MVFAIIMLFGNSTGLDIMLFFNSTGLDILPFGSTTGLDIMLCHSIGLDLVWI